MQNTDYAQSYQTLSRRGAELARQIAGSDCLVAGSLGPGWKSPMRGEITKSELAERYYLRALGLLQGQVDYLWVETVYDPLQAEAAVKGCQKAISEMKSHVKLAVLSSKTITSSDDELIHLLKELNQLPIDILGLNCSSGPQSMITGLEWLSSTHISKSFACCPNAGTPDAYLKPDIFAQSMLDLNQNYNLPILGGCCGVGPEHIKELARRQHEI